MSVVTEFYVRDDASEEVKLPSPVGWRFRLFNDEPQRFLFGGPAEIWISGKHKDAPPGRVIFPLPFNTIEQARRAWPLLQEVMAIMREPKPGPCLEHAERVSERFSRVGPHYMTCPVCLDTEEVVKDAEVARA